MTHAGIARVTEGADQLNANTCERFQHHHFFVIEESLNYLSVVPHGGQTLFFLLKEVGLKTT